MNFHVPQSKKIIGYADKLTVRPGDEINFKISVDEGPKPCSAELVKLINGDVHSNSPGFKEEKIGSYQTKSFLGATQPIHQGSFIEVQDYDRINSLTELTLFVSFMPTTPENGVQHLLCKYDKQNICGWSIQIDATGCLAFHVSTNASSVQHCSLEYKPVANVWHRLVVRLSYLSNTVRMTCMPIAKSPAAKMGLSLVIDKTFNVTESPIQGEAPLMLAAAFGGRMPNGQVIPVECYNGRLEGPRIIRGNVDESETNCLLAGEVSKSLGDRTVANWDFSDCIGKRLVRDMTSSQLHGTIYNFPTSAVRGPSWDGSTMDWKQAPSQYGALHFHQDDLYDCGWETSVSYKVDEDLQSGIYALKVVVEGHEDLATNVEKDALEDYIPFFVAPNKAQAKCALIVPTFTYLAYGNIQLLQRIAEIDPDLTLDALYETELMGPGMAYYGELIKQHKNFGLSTYDRHCDGSPVTYSSFLRPLLTIRPKSVLWTLGADLLMIDWLEAKGVNYDIITDDLLEAEGSDLLKGYQTIITGNHPEYPTTDQLDALNAFIDNGGRLMYMGGNGYYWRSSLNQAWSAALEVRRGRIGTLDNCSDIGEAFYSGSGELGGLCRELGRPPQELTGVGYICAGAGASYYRILPEAKESEAGFVFNGVKNDIIGDYGILGGGAAGQEFDNTSSKHGTPEHTIVLARSENHGFGVRNYAMEERSLDICIPDSVYLANMFAEMVYFDTPNNGAVFSVGSMSWVGSLSHNNYDNDISRITENVLNKFLS